MTQEKNSTAADPAAQPDDNGNENLPRVFIYNGNELPDTLPNESPESVMKLLASHFPELANGEFSEEIKEGRRIIRFRKKATVNGRRSDGPTIDKLRLRPSL